MHPHLNCPSCQAERLADAYGAKRPEPLASLEDVTIFLRDRAGTAHQITAERMLQAFTITKKEKS